MRLLSKEVYELKLKDIEDIRFFIITHLKKYINYHKGVKLKKTFKLQFWSQFVLILFLRPTILPLSLI